MNSHPRNIFKIVAPQTVIEGAGVRLKRSIATTALDHLDPFLLFDHFGSPDPADYVKGFPMHPHRGIETVTYMIRGTVNHKDSLGNQGSISSGDVQWMTSGGGIMHEEMPQPGPDEMIGFQLWVNLPARLKMCSPRYQEISADQILRVRRSDGITIGVIAGEMDGVRGPVTDIEADPVYLDISIPADCRFEYGIPRSHTAFAYVFEGQGRFDRQSTQPLIGHPRLVQFGAGDYVSIQTETAPVRFLLISGKPLDEPIVRHGPFVMNTQAEIAQALADLRNGTFVKS
jgi:redox-sensitive bicupin YhaK (pirin superfamily)